MKDMSLKFSLKKIKAEAQRLGFSACGAARSAPVDEDTAVQVRRWIAKGQYADMTYMANYTEKRLNPNLLVPHTKTILSLAMNYAPAQTMPAGEYQLAAYALGLDYHDIMKKRLRALASIFPKVEEVFAELSDLSDRSDSSELSDVAPSSSVNLPPPEIRVFVDTAPVLERYWAWKAGLGWVGKSHQLIIPKAGTMFFLGEIFLPYELDEYDEPMKNRCGGCHRCIDACPTCALAEETGLDAERCLSYQLIENRGKLSDKAKAAMGDTIYGCDLCQKACPWNRFSTPNTTPEFQPKPELLQMKKEDWHNLTIEQYRQLFKGSAVKRAKYEGLKRNIDAQTQK